ncbi:RNA polymerase sigma factor [Kordiimonas pumila]|uniref:RNA polymerase sigma factor n=1 Tax=Kordiimonas pumila TaxID=2161677 RepID=A0ABV7D5Q4_9PROT|nr:RNA polymerase sigma factor [Kordiimonas pumila]
MSKIYESFIEHEKALKHYLRRFFSRAQDIEDIAQETFLKAFATEIRTDVRSPKALLFRAAKHLALNELAKKANTTTDYTEDFGGSDVFLDRNHTGAEAQIDSKRKLIVFSKALASLPPACKQVFILRKVEGLSAKEVAIKLNISVSGVEKHIAVGLMKCSQYFRENGYDPADFGMQVKSLAQKKAKDTDLGQGQDD